MSACMIENVRPQIDPRNRAIGGAINSDSHLCRNRLGPQDVGNVLLGATDSIGQLGLRAKESDGALDVWSDAHTRFLVKNAPLGNKETCLAPHKGAGRIAAIMTIAANIRKLRKKAKLSQAELGRRAGVAQQLISQIENGVNQDTKKLPEIAIALGCRVEEIDPDFYLLPDDSSRQDIVARFKSLLATDDETVLRDLDEHMKFLEFRHAGQPDGSTEESR